MTRTADDFRLARSLRWKRSVQGGRRVLVALALLTGTVFGLALVLAGVAGTLLLVCAAALLPLVLLGLLGLWAMLVDRVWIRVRVAEPRHTLDFTLPLPLSLMPLVSVLGRYRDMAPWTTHLPWDELRKALRREPLTVEILEPHDRAAVYLVVGPRRACRRHPFPKEDVP